MGTCQVGPCFDSFHTCKKWLWMAEQELSVITKLIQYVLLVAYPSGSTAHSQQEERGKSIFSVPAARFSCIKIFKTRDPLMFQQELCTEMFKSRDTKVSQSSSKSTKLESLTCNNRHHLRVFARALDKRTKQSCACSAGILERFVRLLMPTIKNRFGHSTISVKLLHHRNTVGWSPAPAAPKRHFKDILM